MLVDITKPRWRAKEACAIAGYANPILVRNMRTTSGLQVGSMQTTGGRLFSILDIAELTTLRPLQALHFELSAAIRLARQELRPSLADVLNNRLAHGFWSLAAVELDEDTPYGRQTRCLYLDQIAERVITELKLPLPVNPLPRTIEIGLRMVDEIFDYIFSPPGRLRWNAWHDLTIARGGIVPIDTAAAELGVPPWFMRALLLALAREAGVADPVVVRVRPKAPKVAEHLAGVTLQ